ncbi:unnamed protein product [Musa acuminata var. zebrina]
MVCLHQRSSKSANGGTISTVTATATATAIILLLHNVSCFGREAGQFPSALHNWSLLWEQASSSMSLTCRQGLTQHREGQEPSMPEQSTSFLRQEPDCGSNHLENPNRRDETKIGNAGATSAIEVRSMAENVPQRRVCSLGAILD